MLINSCLADVNHELPLVTHYDKTTNAYNFNGVDVPDIINHNAINEYRSGQYPVYLYKNNIIPKDIGFTSNFDNQTFDNDFVYKFFEDLYSKTKVNFVLKKSKYELVDNANGLFEHDNNGQLVNSIVFKNNLFSIILPPNWNPSNKYPLIINGFYGLNVNVFKQEGPSIFNFVAEKYKSDNIGAIGILWNGGGAIGTYTAFDKNYQDLNEFLNIIIPVLNIDRNNVIAFGNSRGAYTALNIASHSKVTSIKVKYVWATNPFSDVILLSKTTGTTIPNLMYAIDSYGYYGSWTKNYPNTAPDPNENLNNPNKIFKLKKNKTQIHLDMGSHDVIVPYIGKVNLFDYYKKKGVRVELENHYLSGHYADRTNRDKSLLSVVLNDNKNYIKRNKVNNYLLTETGSEIKIKQKPLSIEIPRYLNDYIPAQYIFVGEPNKKYRLTFYNKEAGLFYETIKLNSNGNFLKEIDYITVPYGENELVLVEVMNKGYKQLKTYKTTKPMNENIKMFHSSEHPTNFYKRPEEIVFQMIRGNDNEYAIFRDGNIVPSNNGLVAF